MTRRLHYDVRTASQSYSNVATVIAGFAFAAVVLVVQSKLPNVPDATLLRDWATIALLLAFFGCLGAAFTFAVVSGEEMLAPRSHAMALLGGAGFAVSTVYVFWGLVLLMKLFLSPSIVNLARWIFGGVTLIAPMYLILSVFDPIIAFDQLDAEQIKIPARTRIQLFALGYTPIILSTWGRVVFFAQLNPIAVAYFDHFVIASFVLICMGAGWALSVSDSRHTFRIHPGLGGFWIFLHSCVSGFLLVLLP